MMKVQRRQKLAREKTRQFVPVKTCRATLYDIQPDPSMPFRVRLHLSPTRRHMKAAVAFSGKDEACTRTQGMVRSYHVTRDGRACFGPKRVVADMFLNVRDLRYNAYEIISHECTHAGMAWARLRKAELKKMVGEEVLCHASGQMTKQVFNICIAAGVFA